MIKRRYALCGLSCRGIYHFALPLLGMNGKGGTNFDDRAELVGLLDLDAARVEAFLGKINRRIPIYPADALPRMIAGTRPDVVLVAGPDYTHCDHIVGALNAGCEVIVEKPMVISSAQIRKVQAAEKRSGHAVKVAFNYRYTPTHKRLKRMILEGMLGRILNVEFTYNLDTWHGSSYFYRWNRERAKSGGLSIHKCCHHFDLINWLLGDVPEEVFAFGRLNYYGANGLLRPRDGQGRPLSPADEKRQCPVFAKHYAGKADPEKNDLSTGWDTYTLPYAKQYPADQWRYIYDQAIDIEDTYSAVVRYRGGASLSYSCNFCTPWEGYILGINGSKGRVEIAQHSNPDPTGRTAPAEEKSFITFLPLFGGREQIEIPAVAGGHGGADFVIQRDLFDRVCDESRELKLVAGSADGANSVAFGEAVWRSIQERRPISIPELLAGT
jgi:predicted dehydrogenase